MKKAVGIFSLFLLLFVLSGCEYKIVKVDNSQQTQQSANPQVSASNSDAEFNSIWNGDEATSSEPSSTSTKEQQSNTTATNQAPDVDLEIKCADAAKKMFGSPASSLDSYTSHWNKKLNICFILDQYYYNDSPSGMAKGNDLYDVYENRQWGAFFESNATKSMGSPDCEMYPGGRLTDDAPNFKKCNSEAEFDDFVRPYMND